MKYFAYCRKSSEGEERQALSIPAQIDEIKRAFGDASDIEIVAWFEEAMSAKTPGRPIYAAMIAGIENREADGIIAWHPDRLARNSVDGGWLVHMLDRKVLKDLKFVSYRFEHGPEGLFMLQIMFGQSKYYVDNLSVNVKRGMRKKIELGWWSNLAPMGYRNDRETGTIVIDSDRFAILRGAWELLLTGAYTVSQIHTVLTEEWGFRTPKHKKRGGGPIARSALYKLFRRPFYAGILDWSGEWRPGKHKPMISLDEFHMAQMLLNRPSRPKPETHEFAYTGRLIRCACGLSVTAEEKVKRSGRRYVYYHCTRRTRPRCNQPPARLEAIEDRILDLLQSLRLPPRVEDFLAKRFDGEDERMRTLQEQRANALTRSHDQVKQELRTLVDLRVRDLLTDNEYTEQRRKLRQEELRLEDTRIREAAEPPVWLELGRSIVLFRNHAAKWFSEGSLTEKRMILQTVGWNSVLADRILSIDARFPFKPITNQRDIIQLCASVDALGTDEALKKEAAYWVEAIAFLKDRSVAREAGTPAPPLSLSLAKWQKLRRPRPR